MLLKQNWQLIMLKNVFLRKGLNSAKISAIRLRHLGVKYTFLTHDFLDFVAFLYLLLINPDKNDIFFNILSIILRIIIKSHFFTLIIEKSSKSLASVNFCAKLEKQQQNTSLNIRGFVSFSVFKAINHNSKCNLSLSLKMI